MSGAPSALWAHGYHGSDNGPNSTSLPAGDGMMSCSDLIAAVCPPGDTTGIELAKRGMPCSTANNYQQTVRSLHPQGANVCFADGSVHFISDFIEVGSSDENLGVWDKLNLSNDRQPIDASKY